MAAALGPWFTKLRPPIKTMTAFGGMMVGRNDLPHVFKMTQSARSALHVARMVARHARDRLSHSRGTRLVNGNALIARLAVNAFARGIPLWLHTPVVELVREGGRVTGAIVERDGKRVARSQFAAAWCWPAAAFPPATSSSGASTPMSRPARATFSLPPPGNTGDGLRLAQTVGGIFHGEVHQPAAWTPVSLVPQPDGSIIPFPHFFERGKPGYISVDRRGRRFVNEAHVVSRVRAGPDRGLPRRPGSGGLDRVRPSRHPPLRPRRAGPGADAGAALPAIGLHQARRHRARTRRTPAASIRRA